MNAYKTLKITLISLATFLLFFKIFFAFSGLYFSGDTISHFEYASIATDPLMAIIIHPREWPPFLGLLLHFFINFTPDNHIFILLSGLASLVVAWASVYLFSRKISLSKLNSVVIASGVLLLPIQGIVHTTFISEAFMINFWILSSIFLYLFLVDKKESYLVLFAAFASLIPMTRYLGSLVVLWYCLLLGFTFLTSIIRRKKTKYSRWLLVLSTMIVWIPITFFLFRTKILIGAFFGSHDMKYDFNLLSTINTYLIKVLKDMGLISGILFLLGLTLPKNKHLNKLLLVFGGSSIIYLLGLLNVERVYAIYEHLPSRFTLVSYPGIALSMIFLGTLIKDKFLSNNKLFNKNIKTIKQLIYLTFIVLFGFTIFNQSKLYLSEKELLMSQVEGVLWSGDVRKICREYQVNAIVRHEASRNWGLRSFPMICKQTVRSIDLNSENRLIYRNEGVVSGYKINLEELNEHESMIWDNYPVYIYTANKDVELPLEEIFTNRKRFQ